MNFDDLRHIPSPCYVVDISALRRNAELLRAAQNRSGCRILLALKGFAMRAVFPLLRQYLRGAEASSLNEARLAREEFGGEVHVYAPAYRPDEFDALLDCADHVSFNSFNQWLRFKPAVEARGGKVSCGIRVNPEHSEVGVPLYDPCRPGSRLGVTREHFRPDLLDGISGLHFHTLCELNSDALERTVQAFEARFGDFIPAMQWVNFGGGHHITRPDYDLERLYRVIGNFKSRYPAEVYLEPGEAAALDTGVLVASVLDVTRNDMDIAILDTSAATHMPDVIEMPYKPRIQGAGEPGEYPHNYRLGGVSCLAGDVIGEYSFPEPLRPGSRLMFMDMAHYTMVKNTTFNGVNLPSIAVFDPDSAPRVRIVSSFGYEDYRGRL